MNTITTINNFIPIRIQLIIGLICLLLSTAILSISVNSFSSRKPLTAQVQSINGHLIDVFFELDHHSFDTSFKTSFNPSFHPDDDITVYYNPKDPTDILIISSLFQLFGFQVLVVAGSIVFTFKLLLTNYLKKI